MARPNKIEQLGCQQIVIDGLKADKSFRAIAEECSAFAGEAVSHLAIMRYAETVNAKVQKEKKAVIVTDRRRVVKVVNQDFDIIQLALRTTGVLVDRFETISNLPDLFDERMAQIMDGEKEDSFLRQWSAEFSKELRRRCVEITSLNREIRENSKFLADLREKAFQFSLLTEFMEIFIQIFAKEDAEACNRALAVISGNPRLQKLMEMRQAGVWGGGEADAQTG